MKINTLVMPSQEALNMAQRVLCSEIYANGKKAKLFALCDTYFKKHGYEVLVHDPRMALRITEAALQFRAGVVSVELAKQAALPLLEPRIAGEVQP